MERAPFFACCPLCEAQATTPVVSFPELTFVRCVGCGLIYKSEQRPSLARPYDEAYFRHNRAKYLSRWEHRVRKCRNQVLQCLEYAPHARTLLDVGCSAGYVLEGARRAGLVATGVDLDEFPVKLCKERGFEAKVGSLLELPFPEASFDIVMLKHTLEHVEDPLRALEELRRVLTPGGVAFVVVPDAAYYKIPLMPRQGRSFRPDRRGWQHHVYFYAPTLADACRRAGLLPVKAGKDIFRKRLARGLRWPVEALRYAWMLLWTHGARLTRLRRELQLIVQRPHDGGAALPASRGVAALQSGAARTSGGVGPGG